MRAEADLVLLNGRVRTMNDHAPVVEAAAISGDRILATGATREMQRLETMKTTVVDLEGRCVLPGLMDAHFHFYDWAVQRRHLPLADVSSFDGMMRRIRDAARNLARGDWLIGQGWNEADWPENRMPTREDLDAAAPHHPAIFWRCDMHLAVANSAALDRAGVGPDTPDPNEGLIDRDAAGRPTGILKESAIHLIRDVIPEPTEIALADAFADGAAHLHTLGLTTIHDVRIMGGRDGADSLKTWQHLHNAGALKLRTWVSLPGERLQQAVDLGLASGFGDDRLRIGCVKFFADGGMGARTAWMLEPYLDADAGMPLTPMGEIEAAVQQAEQAGLSVMVHAIGDRANRDVVGIFERRYASPAANGFYRPALPHRMEHVQMIRPEDAVRLGKLPRVAACMQPHNMILDINMVDESVGERGRWVYAFKRLMDAGVPVMFSSDAPVCDPSPLVGIHAAVTRQRRDGAPKGGWHPDQRLSVDQAVRAYTVIPARMHGAENDLGGIAPGKKADMVVLDRDIYAVDPMEIADARVVMTVFDGEVVFQTS